MFFASCAGTEDRKPITSVDTRFAGKSGSDGTGGTSGTDGSGGKRPSQGSTNAGKANVGSELSGGGESGGPGSVDISGGGGAEGGGPASSNGSGVSDDCSSDADCPHGHCITLEVGFRTCQTPPVEATECSPNPSQDDCCKTSDCRPGLSCFSTRAFNYINQPEFNVCTSDECTRDADCLNDELCVPKGALGRPVAACISAVCHSDADCPGGRCAPMIDECSGGYWTFACAYSGPGSCKTTADCSSDTPPFGPGDRYCHLGSCTDLIQGTDCN